MRSRLLGFKRRAGHRAGSAGVVCGLFLASCAQGEVIDDPGVAPGASTGDASVPECGSGGSSCTGDGGSRASGGASSTGGIASSQGGTGAGGAAAATGGTPSSGASGGTGSGGVATGGATTGGTSAGGKATGGINTGGTSTGGKATGGVATGGVNTGGVATGGMATGGVATGGAATGGSGPTCANYTVDDNCSRCLCSKCSTQVAGCFSSNDAQKNQQCKQVEDCAETNHCASTECYCGDSPGCLAPNGACRSVIETVTGTTNALDINTQANDTGTPLGRANQIGLCAQQNCVSDCGL